MPEIWIILARPKNELNIGSVVRLATNFRASGIRIAGIDDFDRQKALITAPNCEEDVKAVTCYPTMLDAVKNLQVLFGFTARLRKFQATQDYLTPGEAAEKSASELSTDCKIGLVFGSEDSGLSNDELNLCNFAVTIPTDKNQSLNLAMSVSIGLYEFFTELNKPEIRKNPFTNPENLATVEEMSRIYGYFSEFLELIKFNKYSTAEVNQNTVDRILKKLHLTQRENKFLIAVIKQMLHAYRANNPPSDEK